VKVTLTIWRQKDSQQKGALVRYPMDNISEHMSFLEVLDVLNEQLISEGKDPIAFDHDCREGICGSCSLVVNGVAHGPERATTVCQLHMRSFKEGDEIFVEPWRAKSFPVIKDLVVDRSSLDRITQKGGFISVNSGGSVDANTMPIGKTVADIAMDAAACIGCGACVAACKNASAMLFVAAKVSHLGRLPQGKIEQKKRVTNMLESMQEEGFGACTNTAECSAVCPKDISQEHISYLNREYMKASLCADD
jgi:succinate dehydrogenase / fumarate reductase, iron-sulfur subunit